MNKKFLALQLRLLRGQQTQAETARIFGVAQQTYSGWENPKAGGTPDITEIRSICQHYGCTADWLLGVSDRSGSSTPSCVAESTDTYKTKKETECAGCVQKEALIAKLVDTIHTLSINKIPRVNSP